MKRMILITLLAVPAALSACGGADHIVSRNTSAPLSFAAVEADLSGDQSSRAVVDLLSF